MRPGERATPNSNHIPDGTSLDNNKNPSDGLIVDFKQVCTGVGGDVSYLKSQVDGKYYKPLVSEIVGLIHLQGGILNKVGDHDIRMLDHFQWVRISSVVLRQTESVRRYNPGKLWS